MTTAFTEAFEAQFMQAIVRQFFENPPLFGTLPDGQVVNIPPRTTPVQAVAGKLLSEKNAELLEAIMDAVDIDVLAHGVADEVLKVLKAPEPIGYGLYDRSPAAAIRKRLKEKVDARLVELIAQDIHARMKADDEADAEVTGS